MFQRYATVGTSTPAFVSGVENPKPGSEGTITSNDGDPFSLGDESGVITSRKSQKVHGHPWVKMIGIELLLVPFDLRKR